MDIRARRALLPAVLAIAFLLTAGWHAVPARATSVDPELVAESVTEDGYYVDSDASYLKSDADLDKLREALQKAGRAAVVVLPPGAASGPVLTRLMQTPNRKATYLVLSGTRLHAESNNLPKSKIDKYLATSDKAGNPKAKVMTFLGLLDRQEAHAAKKKGKSAGKSGNLPLAGGNAAKSGAPAPATPAAAAGRDSGGGGNGLLYGLGGLAAVVVAALGGLLAWRRKKGGSGGAPGSPGAAGPVANA